ncbi:MAG: hypothetical protein KY476_02810 [Planctomycetes bacterium]|nr:hypothetical protein [Planctomycetota bacterium]
MIALEWDELTRDDGWQQVLAAYSDSADAARRQQEAFDGWTPRLESVEGVAGELLSRLHGRLIAAGLLKFQLADRTTGLCYQLSPQGRRRLAGESQADDDSADSADAEEDRTDAG